MKFIKKINEHLFGIILGLFKRVNKSQQALSIFVKKYNEKNNCLLRVKQYPLETEHVLAFPFQSDYSNISIVMQGPIKMERHFTLETIRLYKKLFPKCQLIFSTWENQDAEEISKIKLTGAIVIENSKPVFTGTGNINLQKKSTVEGLLIAKSLNYQYVLKTRSDQRMVKPNFLSFFLNLLKSYNVNDILNIKQKNRIIVLQSLVPGSMFIPFHISDFLFFGHIDDVLSLFDFPDEKINISTEQRIEKEAVMIKKDTSVYEFHHSEAPEIIIFENYLRNHDISEQLTVKLFWEFMENYLVSVSYDSIGFYWEKERFENENSLTNLYSDQNNSSKMMSEVFSFENWFLLFSKQINYRSEYELYSKQPMSRMVERHG